MKKTSDDSTVQAFNVTSEISGSDTSTITINPSSDLESATSYYVQIDASAFEDTFSNSYAGINDTTTWNFSTADAGVPTGSISINNGSAYTNSPSVTLNLSASDSHSRVSQVMISNSSTFEGASWQDYATSKIWTLTSGDGTKTVYIKFRDDAGALSEAYSDTIVLDTMPPQATLLDYPAETVSGDTPEVAVSFTWTGSDPAGFTPVDELLYQYKLEGHSDYQKWSGWSSGTIRIYTLPPGNYTFKVRAKDGAGNYPAEDDSATAKSSLTVSIAIIIYPNPCYPNQPDHGRIVTIANLPLNSEVKIYIYDAAGNLVRTLGESEASIEGGSKTVIWDLRNDQAEIVARGTYICFIPAATEKKTRKIAIIK